MRVNAGRPHQILMVRCTCDHSGQGGLNNETVTNYDSGRTDDGLRHLDVEGLTAKEG
jgi:hypothetical protein